MRPYLVLHAYQCTTNDDCPIGSSCLHNICFWSHCLASPEGIHPSTEKANPETTGFNNKYSKFDLKILFSLYGFYSKFSCCGNRATRR